VDQFERGRSFSLDDDFVALRAGQDRLVALMALRLAAFSYPPVCALNIVGPQACEGRVVAGELQKLGVQLGWAP